MGVGAGIDCNRHKGSSVTEMFLNWIVVMVAQLYTFTKCKLNKLVKKAK